jgi:4-hydroxybenzoate polyprenyltransferase
MSRLRATVKNYAELGRVSNLPTCVTNVLVGCAVGAEAASMPPLTVAAAIGGIALLYVGGMALNDAVDAKIDSKERAERPIPSGRISRRAAYTFVFVTFLLGLALLAACSLAALGLGSILTAAIIVYDVTHKKHAASVVLMGACRGLVYLVAAAAVGWPLQVMPIAAFATAITLYTILFTVIARAETHVKIGGISRLSLALPLSVLPLAAFQQPTRWLGAGLAGSMLLLWLLRSAAFALRKPPRTIRAVLGWLSGFCLLDAYFLTLLDRPLPALAAVVCFLVTVWGHRRILGT